MLNHIKKIFFISLCVISNQHLQSNNQLNPYQQIHSELLKKTNTQDPSIADQKLITACQLINLYGSSLKPIQEAVWQAITSAEMITEILPRLHRTHTTFGYISLARQCAQMSSNITELNKKTELIKYLNTHQNVFSDLNLIIKQSALAEEIFLNLCKNHNEEELENQNKINQKLYYNMLPFLNENNLALGFWTRLNQLHTLAWYTIPTLLGSNIHKNIIFLDSQISLYEKNCSLFKNMNNLSDSELASITQEIEKLEEFLKQNPIFTQKAYKDLTLHIEKVDPLKQSKIEKIILNSPSDLPFIIKSLWKDSKSEVIKYITLYINYFTKHFVIDGVQNTPAFYKDIAKKTTTSISHHYKNNPIYNDLKDNLACNGWNKDEAKTKLVAGTGTMLTYSWIAAWISVYPYILHSRYKSTKELFDIVAEKQRDLIQASHLIRSLKQVNTILNQNKNLSLLIPEHNKLAALFNPYDKKTSSDLKTLIKTCLSSSFCEESYYFSQQGKILAAHHLFMRTKHELTPYLQAYGTIDANLSNYKLYAEFKDHKNARICIPEFIENENPQLIIKNFWHPLINPAMVTTNSLNMGTSDLTANLIITGPNAGGKTTALTGLLINIIMAQSYGIAAASNLSLTPFAKIHSYLDITTNLIEGESLFKAEVNRSKKLKESILSCSYNEKSFTIIDELFSGTNPEVASTVGLKFAEFLGKTPHSMSIITTHFPKITEIEEQTGRFQNYKVADAYIAQDGTVTYPFKLEKGKSTQNIAQHMLEQEGII